MFFSLLSLSQGSGGGGESIFSFQGIEEGGGDFKGKKGGREGGYAFILPTNSRIVMNHKEKNFFFFFSNADFSGDVKKNTFARDAWH